MADAYWPDLPSIDAPEQLVSFPTLASAVAMPASHDIALIDDSLGFLESQGFTDMGGSLTGADEEAGGVVGAYLIA